MRTITVYDDEPIDPDGHVVITEEREARGWVVLVRDMWCPDKCQGGEVLAGGDLVSCRVCDGGAKVGIGIGGAYVDSSWSASVPEEPEEFFYRTTLRYFNGPQREDADE